MEDHMVSFDFEFDSDFFAPTPAAAPAASTAEYDSIVDRLDSIHMQIFGENFNSVSNKELIAFTENQLQAVEDLRKFVPADELPRIEKMIDVLRALIKNLAALVDLE
jgi:hypothetical protein